MTVNNKLNKSFGPVGATTGVIIFAIGLVMTFHSLVALFLVLFGAFIGLTYSSALIDYDKKRIKSTTNLFGIIKIGKWIEIDSNMKVHIKNSNRMWRSYSGSNRTLDISDKGFMLILVGSNNKPIMPVKKVKTIEEAKESVEILNEKLALSQNI